MNTRAFLVWTALVFSTLAIMLTQGRQTLGDTSTQTRAEAATSDTIAGQILLVDLFRPGEPDTDGVTLTVAANNETLLVRLGPVWLVEEKGLQICVKDSIVVVGSRTQVTGRRCVEAAIVTVNGTTHILRKEKGPPNRRLSSRGTSVRQARLPLPLPSGN